MVEAVFLDRDGVINVNRSDYVRSWEDFVFLPGSIEAVGRLCRAHLPVFIVTNQSIIGRKLVSKETVEDINRRMLDAMAAAAVCIQKVYYCPHTPSEDCSCRKPKPGMLWQAAREFDIDLSKCVLVGDAASDIEAGGSVGCRTILVRSGRGSDTDASAIRPDDIVDDLNQAVDVILSSGVGD